jgi:4-hydroxy 2-oxovalerate aldolase
MTTNNNNINQVQILDCTIRDGGYINNWNFEKKFVREIYRALSKAGVDYVEVGFRGTERYFDKSKYGLWRFSDEKDIFDVVTNISGARLAIMADFGRIEINDFCNAKDSAVELVRIAAHKNDLKEAILFLEQIQKKGYKVSLNAMGYTNYSESERRSFLEMIKSSSLDFIYIADSYGSLFPDQISSIFEPLLNIQNLKVGFHPHNSLQMAFANVLEAIRCGVHIVDCTIYGMGRAAGNLPTEIIISFLEREQNDRYNSIPILNIIDRYFVSMQKENPWGYQLPYMLSGMFQCHPNYAKTLIDYREYTIEDIWKAMAIIKEMNPVGFSKTVLHNLINTGHIGSIEGAQKNKLTINIEKSQHNNHPKPGYIDRFEGRDFLILANGPTLKEYKPKIDRFIAKYNPVMLGANYLGGLFKPDFHAFNNKRRFVDYIDSVAPESSLLIGQYIPDEMIREYTDRDYEKIIYKDEFSDFGIDNGIITANCRTIAVLLLGVAIVMGAKRVFAVGMDGYMGINDFHFYNEKDEKEDREMIIERHRSCQKYIEQIDEYLIRHSKEGVLILTPTSYKSFYKGIDNYL